MTEMVRTAQFDGSQGACKVGCWSRCMLGVRDATSCKNYQVRDTSADDAPLGASALTNRHVREAVSAQLARMADEATVLKHRIGVHTSGLNDARAEHDAHMAKMQSLSDALG